MTTDRLELWEKAPLALALLAQSYVVGLWYYASISGAHWIADLIVAVGAGLALDLIVVTTVMGRRAGRSSGWSWGTAFGAFVCSSLIALDRYGWELRSALHVAFPLVVFLYSQHLATVRKASLQTLQDGSGEAEGVGAVSLDVAPGTSAPVASALVPLELSAYRCPHCQAALANKQSVGAAVKNGYCKTCKAERIAA